MKYDFLAARQRQQELIMLYRQGRHLNPDDPAWGWDLIALIDEIDQEIEEVHQGIKGKMTAMPGGHNVVQLKNVYVPIIPQWTNMDKLAK